jgi:hypothetical protein
MGPAIRNAASDGFEHFQPTMFSKIQYGVGSLFAGQK